MSSVYCVKCKNMLWDKVKGFTKGSNEVHINNKTWASICGKCKHKEIKHYSDFDIRYGLNKPKDQIDMIKVKELINIDLKNNYWNNKNKNKRGSKK